MDLGGAVATGDSPFQPLQPFQWRPRFGRRSALGVAGALLGGRHGAHDLVDMLAAAAPGGLVAACAFDGVTHDVLLGVKGDKGCWQLVSGSSEV